MLHKHKRSGKTTTGVADYFAVLGIDSFLPSPPDSNNDDYESGGIATSDDNVGVANNICVSLGHDEEAASIKCTTNNSNQPSIPATPSTINNIDETNYENERLTSMSTVHADNLSSSTKTSRYSNLSKHHQQQKQLLNTTPEVGNSNVVVGENYTDDDNLTKSENNDIDSSSIAKKKQMSARKKRIRMNHEEYKLEEQRFQREIVQLALLSLQSSSS